MYKYGILSIKNRDCVLFHSGVSVSPESSIVCGPKILNNAAAAAAAAAAAKSLQSCPTLCDPMDSSPPGSSIHRILQVRILEWVAIFFSKKAIVDL